MKLLTFYLFKAASRGNLDEFQRLYKNDPKRLNTKDAKGFTVAHKAAESGRVNVLEFIRNKGGGRTILLSAAQTLLK